MCAVIHIKWNRKILVRSLQGTWLQSWLQYLNLTRRHARARVEGPQRPGRNLRSPHGVLELVCLEHAFIAATEEIQLLVACGSTSSISTQEKLGDYLFDDQHEEVNLRYQGLAHDVRRLFSSFALSSFVSADWILIRIKVEWTICKMCAIFNLRSRTYYIQCNKNVFHIHLRHSSSTGSSFARPSLYSSKCRIPLLTHLHKKYVMQKCIKYKQMKRQGRNYICVKRVYMFFYPLENSYHDLEQRVKGKLLIVTMDRTCKTFQCWLHWSDRSNTT